MRRQTEEKIHKTKKQDKNHKKQWNNGKQIRMCVCVRRLVGKVVQKYKILNKKHYNNNEQQRAGQRC